MTIQVRRLGHATFTTPDLERQVAYYSEVLGLNVIERGKDRAFLATKSGLEAIALEKGSGVDLTRLSFQLAPGSDLGDAGRELDRHGVKNERRQGLSPGVKDAIVFTDLKGTAIELYTEYAFAADDGRPAVITPLKLGHVAHRVGDVQAVVKFYTEVLGFRVSDWRDDTFAFLRRHVVKIRERFREAAAPSHRLRGGGLGRAAPRQRLSRQERHPAGLGTRPPHHRPQHRRLSPQLR